MRRFPYSVLGTLIVIAAIAGGIFALHPGMFIKVVTGISGWVLLACQWAYGHWERVYLFVQRVRLIFVPDTTWDMSVTYSVSDNGNVLNQIQDQLLTYEGWNEKKVSRTLPGCLDVVGDGIRLQVIQAGDNCVEVYILNTNVTVSKTEFMLGKRIAPILERIESVLHPLKKRFYLTVKFDGNQNPYFGLYLRRLTERNVTHFDVTFNVQDGDIELHQNSLTIKTNSFSDMFTLSRKYVSLGS